METLTEKTLGIFWDGAETDEEVDGILAYGYFKNKPNQDPMVKIRTSGQFEIGSHDLVGNSWYVFMFEVRIVEWPSSGEWASFLKGVLDSLIKAGASVAWCGLEGVFVDPPFLFDPSAMNSSGIYAAMSENIGFKCTAYLNEPYKGFSQEDLTKLRQIVRE